MLLILSFLTLSSHAVTVTDDANHTFTFAKPYQRIISLSPDLTEDIFAIGAQTKLVGVLAGSNYPQAANEIAIVGSYQGLDIERILQLKPDLIISWDKNFAKQLMILKKMSIPIYISNPQHLTDIAHTLKNLSVLTGNVNAATRIVQSYEAQLSQLTNHYQSQKKVNVFYQIGDSRFTINKTSWINDVIMMCGGNNIYANVAARVLTIDMEAIIKAQPDVIISSSNNDKWKQHYQRWPRMKAVATQQLYSIESDLLERPTLRILQGAKQLCQYLSSVRIKNNKIN